MYKILYLMNDSNVPPWIFIFLDLYRITSILLPPLNSPLWLLSVKFFVTTVVTVGLIGLQFSLAESVAGGWGAFSAVVDWRCLRFKSRAAQPSVGIDFLLYLFFGSPGANFFLINFNTVCGLLKQLKNGVDKCEVILKATISDLLKYIQLFLKSLKNKNYLS